MRRALLIGINDYSFGPLHGCIEDANRMHEVLSTNEDEHYPLNFDCKKLTSDTTNITKSILSNEIEQLFKDESGTIEIALLYFSGHGYENDLDGYLVTPDAQKYSEGCRMQDIIEWVNRSPIREIVIILDCCYSGHLGNYTSSRRGNALLRNGVSILTSCSPGQQALEKNGKGIFTSIVYTALCGGASDILGNITVASVYNYVDKLLGAFDQRPVFKSYVSQMIRLRKTKSKINISQIKQLTTYFKTADYHYPLDPSYEPTEAPAHKKNEMIFSELQRFTSAGLVYPVDEEHMYYAAFNSRACALTPLGKFFWKFIQQGNLNKLLQ